MKISFKTLVIGITILAAVMLLTTYKYTSKINKLHQELIRSKGELAQLEEHTSSTLGTYTTKIALLSSDLEKEKALTKQQKTTLKELQKELGTKITELNNITVQYDSLSSEGVATITIVKQDTLKYHIVDKKNGVGLDFTLWHPKGAYIYTITHDPLNMQVYMASSKDGVKIGAIKFDKDEGIHVTNWDIIYDPDTRPWYTKIWEDIHATSGVLTGNTYGIFATVGYKKISIGPAITNSSSGLIFIYNIK